jgi:hypothetical protein
MLCSSCVVSQKKYDSLKVRHRALINEGVGLEYKNRELKTHGAKLMLENMILKQYVDKLHKRQQTRRENLYKI